MLHVIEADFNLIVIPVGNKSQLLYFRQSNWQRKKQYDGRTWKYTVN